MGLRRVYAEPETLVSSSLAARIGVLPPSIMLAIVGRGISLQKRCISSADSGASRKMMSAPPSRSRGSGAGIANPVTARASVRAMIRMSGRAARQPRRGSMPALGRLTTCLPAYGRTSWGDLVLDHQARRPRPGVLADGALDVEGIAVAGVAVGDDRDVDRFDRIR